MTVAAMGGVGCTEHWTGGDEQTHMGRIVVKTAQQLLG